MNLDNLKIGDKVTLNTLKNSWKTSVTRITKTKVIVKHERETPISGFTSKANCECWFRKSDGKNVGPTTYNVYFLTC